MTEPGWEKRVLDFWYKELEPKQWFEKDDAVDSAIASRFGSVHESLAAAANDSLSATPQSALAAIIVLDQFSRNMFRGSAKSFACDAKALDLAERVIAAGSDSALSDDERYFLYMPFMHSEDLEDQERCIALFEDLGSENGVKYAKLHRDVIAEFGRFPHRNAVLGRETTDAEQAWLDAGGGF